MDDDITHWILGLAQGDARAAELLWQRYYEQLVQTARRRLGSHRRVSDEEDIALSAMHSFCRGASEGRFPRLADREDVWKLLMTITARKAMAHRRREMRQKRGGGTVRGESVFAHHDALERNPGINEILGDQPTPAFAALLTEEMERLLGVLDEPALREIALMKLEGYTNDEIAARLECARRTVERKLARIREKWSQSGDDPEGAGS